MYCIEGEKRKNLKPRAAPGSKGSNKVKNAASSFMPKQEARNYHRSETDGIEPSEDDLDVGEDEYGDEEITWVDQKDVGEVLASLYETNFSVIQDPDETTPGVFQVVIYPNCGNDTAGCHVDLKLSYQRTPSSVMSFEVLPETAVGLTDA